MPTLTVRHRNQFATNPHYTQYMVTPPTTSPNRQQQAKKPSAPSKNIVLKPHIMVEDSRWQLVLYASNMPLEEVLSRACTEGWSAYEPALPDLIRPVECTCLLTNDAIIQELNKDYRDKDAPTNVLSFPQYDNLHHMVEPCPHLGDIAISFDTLMREAQESGKLMHHHLLHLAVHGMLHLLGYDHQNESDAIQMEALEIRILADAGVDNPYA